ncbi:Uncharacterised protein [Acholeplasma oculi]|uniref:Uncharacterized protein n=1 Tax=Acholeplasma oculi TaxID=35623 RepID=A0A061AFB9_9MOLU|nr:hypothetical protein [Acholeplasma oculi]CDR30191.1 hypothetical protein Aocu_01180 [Acholeplasma oculi]SKC36652.1 hypothetical protein SAMN02745122_0410 [Acholeplasma oculi]SKC44070.1 hypothetical protein SAMN02745122_1053 [Acholeplasma oculi]SUT88550.1 Uncharacterised protein [Acholeplasma oculi]
MKYEFKINGVAVSLQDFYIAIHEEIDGDIGWHELLDTTSIEVNGNTYSIEVSNDNKSEIIINLVRKICYDAMSSDYGWSLNRIKESLSKIGFKTIDLEWIKDDYPHEFLVTTTLENEGFIIEINSDEYLKELNDAS